MDLYGMFENSSQSEEEANKEITLNEIRLIPGAQITHIDTNEIDGNSFGTLVTPTRGAKIILATSIGLLLFSSLFVGLFIYILVTNDISTDPDAGTKMIVFSVLSVIFVLLTITDLYSGIMALFSKTWIAVYHNKIYYYNGLLHRPEKYIEVPRDSKSEVELKASPISYNKITIYKIIIQRPEKKFVIAKGMRLENAKQYQTMISDLLRAKL